MKNVNTNLIPKEELNNIIDEVLEITTGCVAETLGPYGKNTLVIDTGGFEIARNKDGYLNLLHLKFQNTAYHAIFNAILQTSREINLKVGDGTTSVIIAADIIYNLCKFYNIEKLLTPAGFDYITIQLVDKITNLINTKYNRKFEDLETDELKEKILRRAALISSNNNLDITNTVVKVFKDHKFNKNLVIHPTTYSGNKTIVEDTKGYELPYGVLHSQLTTESDSRTTKYKNPKYLIIDGPLYADHLKYAEHIISYSISKGPLIIMADDFDRFILTFAIENKNKNNLPICLLKLPTGGLGENKLVQDLEVILGASRIITNPNENPVSVNNMFPGKNSTTLMDTILGGSEDFFSITSFSRIINGSGSDEGIERRINLFKEKITYLEAAQDISQSEKERVVKEYKRKIGLLNNEFISIKVGANSYRERQYAQSVYEDTISSIKNILTHGYAVSGISTFNAVLANCEELISQLINEYFSKFTYGNTSNKKTLSIEYAITVLIAITLKSITEPYVRSLKNAFGEEESNFILKKQFSAIYRLHNLVLDLKNDITNMESIKDFKTIVKDTVNAINNSDNFFDNCRLYNIYTNKLDDLMISPSNMDFNILKHGFDLARTLISSNQLLDFNFKLEEKRISGK